MNTLYYGDNLKILHHYIKVDSGDITFLASAIGPEMEEYIKQIVSNPWFSAAGYMVGLLGLILTVIGIYLAIRSAKDKKPRFSYKSNNLIQGLSKKVDKLQVLFEGAEVETVTVTKVFFWNAGRETIRAEDVATTSPVEIILSEGRILDARLLTELNTNKFEVSFEPDSNRCLLSFEYIDYREMAAIQLVHTSAAGAVTMSGVIKGSRTPIKEKDLFRRFNTVMLMSGFVSLALLALAVYLYLNELLRLSFLYYSLSWLAITLITFVLFIILSIILNNLFVRSPRDMEKFKLYDRKE